MTCFDEHLVQQIFSFISGPRWPCLEKSAAASRFSRTREGSQSSDKTRASRYYFQFSLFLSASIRMAFNITLHVKLVLKPVVLS